MSCIVSGFSSRFGSLLDCASEGVINDIMSQFVLIVRLDYLDVNVLLCKFCIISELIFFIIFYGLRDCGILFLLKFLLRVARA